MPTTSYLSTSANYDEPCGGLDKAGGNMALKESPPGLMEAYKWEMLASRCELAILRSQRLQEVTQADSVAMKALAKHLEAAMDGASGVTSANLSAKSEESILVFQSILNALADQSPIGERIKSSLEKLKEAAMAMAQRELPMNEEVESLKNFVHRYRLTQQDAIRHRHYSASGRVALWGVGQPANSL